jgi:pimeloyl-ACP methyl ester carboxylesterase
LTPVLSEIKTPTLMISAKQSSMVPVDDAKAWTAAMPHGELLVIDSDSYHLAATNPEQCANATLQFIQKVERQARTHALRQ